MTARFDDIVHAPHRLRICSFLDATTAAEFTTLRDMLGVADSVLSKHLKVLHEAEYITLSKPTQRGRVRTWAALTPQGQEAYRNHVAALMELTNR